MLTNLDVEFTKEDKFLYYIHASEFLNQYVKRLEHHGWYAGWLWQDNTLDIMPAGNRWTDKGTGLEFTPENTSKYMTEFWEVVMTETIHWCPHGHNNKIYALVAELSKYDLTDLKSACSSGKLHQQTLHDYATTVSDILHSSHSFRIVTPDYRDRYMNSANYKYLVVAPDNRERFQEVVGDHLTCDYWVFQQSIVHVEDPDQALLLQLEFA